jgi:hypothetical protein
MSSEDDEARTDSFEGHNQYQHNWGVDDSITTTVIQSVADVSGVSQTDLDPIFETVDPDALDQVLASLQWNAMAEVRFDYSGHRVVIRGDGRITVKPLEQ